MFEQNFFLILFLFISAIAIASPWGWLMESNKNNKLLEENAILRHRISALETNNKRLTAANDFYKNCIEEKNDEQKSNKNINR